MADNYDVFSSSSNTVGDNSRAFIRCGDGDSNRTSKTEAKSMVSATELTNNGDTSSMLGSPNKYHEPENTKSEGYCKLTEPTTNDFVELLLKDTRRDHENFTSRLHFLPNDSSSSRIRDFITEAPAPLYSIDVPKLSNMSDDLEYLMDDFKPIVIDGDYDCESHETWPSTGTTHDEDSYVLLSPRTFCRKIESEVTICCPQNQNEVDAPQLFEVDMNEDRTNKESPLEHLPSNQSANLEDDTSIASSIYHAANSESLLSDLGSTHISPSRSQDSVVSGLDSIGASLPRELEKCQGMKMTVEYNAEFDGEFSSNDGPLDMDVLWVNNNVFHNDNGFRSIIISNTTDSPAEEDNDLALEFPPTSSQNLTLGQTPSLEHSFSRFLREQVSSEDRYIEPTSSASIVPSEIELADDASFLTSSSVNDNTDDEGSDSEGSIYDVDFMGRADVFWPMMTKSERKMVGAPSELNLDTHAESETFDVEDLQEAQGHPEATVPPADDTLPLPLADLTMADTSEAHQSLEGRENENPDTSFVNHTNSTPRSDFSGIKRDYMPSGFSFGGSGDDSDVGVLDLGASAWPTLY